jgi:hypothetical protein
MLLPHARRAGMGYQYDRTLLSIRLGREGEGPIHDLDGNTI